MLLSEFKSNKFTPEYHNDLNKKLWNPDSTLKSDVRAALNKISSKFIEYLKINNDHVLDVILTGSNVNYNWTKYSDIDLHLIVDYESICDDCPEFDLDDCMKAKKTLWNEQHGITIHKHDVEIYVQPENEHITGNAGIYSLLNNKWVRKPVKEDVSYDEDLIELKASEIMKSIDDAIDNNVDDIDSLKNIKEKIRKMRKCGLEKNGEFSLENLVFKVLRNSGYLEKLSAYVRNVEDEDLSL